MAEQRYVKPAPKGSTSNNGLDCDHPWPTIQYAVDELAKLKKGGTVWICDQQMDENVTMSGHDYDNIHIQGDNVAAAPGVTDYEWDPYCEVRRRVNGAGKAPVFTLDTVDGIVFKDLDIINGKTKENGGGISAKKASVTIDSCCVNDNNADKCGAGFAFEECKDIVVKDSYVFSNHAKEDGGGGWLKTCKGKTFENTKFFMNQADKSGGGLALVECEGISITPHNLFGGPINKSGMDLKNTADRGGGLWIKGNKKDLKVGASKGDKNKFERNEAKSGGGIAIEANSQGVSLTANQITHNKATAGDGGGIRIAQFDLTQKPAAADIAKCRIDIADNTIQNNEATAGGGGMFAQASSHTRWTNNTVTTNKAGTDGGGVYASADSKIEIQKDNSFKTNTAGARGGALHVSNSEVTCQESEFLSTNTALNGGGIYIRMIDAGAPEDDFLVAVGFDKRPNRVDIKNNDIEENTATGSGGGIYLVVDQAAPQTTKAVIKDSTISRNNAATSGGGVFALRDPKATFDLAIEHNSINENKKPAIGGAIYLNHIEGIDVVKDNQSIEGNEATNGAGVAIENAQVDTQTVEQNIFENNKLGAGKGKSILLKKCTLTATTTLQKIASANKEQTGAGTKPLPPGDVVQIP